MARQTRLPPSIAPLSRSTLPNDLAAQLKRMIQRDGYRSGDRLPSIATLAKDFEVGAPTVREALKRLEMDTLARQRADDLAQLFSLCTQEAQAAFGDGSLYLEKYLVDTHHVEVQIAVDRAGTALHFGERDCSVQRRHQKLVEESPSTALTTKVREEIGRAHV